MTSKRKRSPEAANPVNYWWNKGLFSRTIDFETNLTQEECLRQLRKMVKSERFGARSYPQSDGAGFEIRVRRSFRTVPYTSVKAVGALATDSGSRVTLVRATVRFGWVYYVFVGLPLLLLVSILIQAMFPGGDSTTDSIAYLALIPLIILFVGFFTITLLKDRNRLAYCIVDALHVRTRRPGG